MGSKRTASRLRFEPLEGRDLLSGLLVALQAHVPHPAIAQMAESVSAQSRTSNARVSAETGGAGGGSGSGGSGSSSSQNNSTYTSSALAGVYNGNGVQNSADGATMIGPNASTKFPITALLGTGTPTKAELAREKFVARFSGPLSILPPRFSDQSKIIYLRGLGGSTPNFFLHGDYALALVIPAGFDPKNPGGIPSTTTSPGVAPVTGFAFLDDKNNNSGGVVGLDLLADPSSFDALGRPTRLSFTSDPNVYGGIFFVNQSAGTATIKYGTNTASTTFNGRVYTSDLTNPFQNVDLYAKHSG